MTNKRGLKAFSLIEVSIVILIIGILIVGVTQSSRLVSQAKVNSAKSLTQSSPTSSIPGLVLWVESSSPQESFGDENIEDGETIARWNDINPQNSIRSNFSIGTFPTYSTEGINSIPALSFASSEISTSNFSNINTGKITLFAVVKLSSTLADSTIIGKGAAASRNFELQTLAANTGWSFCTGDSTCYTATSANQATNGAYVISVVYNETSIAVSGSAEAGVTFFQNGDVKTDSITTTTDPSSSTDNLTIGNVSSGADSFFSGLIGEIIIYDRVLKQEERQSVEDYLGKKWGIKVIKEAF